MKQENIELQKAFPASERVFRQGMDSDIKVPFRKINLSETVFENETRTNEPLYVYDTAGPYHSKDYEVDVSEMCIRDRCTVD